MRSKAIAQTFALLAALGLCTPTLGQAAGTQEVVHVGAFLDAIDYAPFYVAQKSGCLGVLGRHLSVRFDYSTFTTVPSVNEAVAHGLLDVIFEADTPAIFQRAAGAALLEITPVAALSQQLLLLPRSPVTALRDLHAKRIGVLPGSGYHFALVDGLTGLGLDPSQYHVVPTGPGEGESALRTGSIDAWAIWPPILQAAVLAGNGRAISGSQSTLNVYAFGRTAFIKNNPLVASGIAKCIRRSIAVIQRHPARAMAVVVARTGIASAVVAAAWPTMSFGFEVDNEAIRVLNAQASFLYQQKFVGREIVFGPADFLDEGRRAPS